MSGTPSNPPPVGFPSETYWPVAPVREPRSSPPGTSWHFVGGKDASAHVAVRTPAMRGAMPAELNTAAAMLPGRFAITAWRNCEVSTNVGALVSCVWLRNPSYEKKKNSLSFRIGPPILPPNWRKLLFTRVGLAPSGPPYLL